MNLANIQEAIERKYSKIEKTSMPSYDAHFQKKSGRKKTITPLFSIDDYF